MRYIPAEKLIAEIEKLLAKAKNDEEKAFTKKDAAGHLAAVTKTAVCVKIKKLIASLQQEQPSLPSNLDEAAESYSENILANGEDMFDAIADGFKAGAEWMAEQGEAAIVKVDVNGMNTPIVYLWGDKWKKYSGDKVVVQIRKK